VVVLNTFLTLLSYHERDDARIKELEEKNAKLVKQLDFTENNLGLTQRELDGSQRESHQLRLRLETSQAELKKTTQQLTTTKEDLKKTTSRAQSSKTQFLHDLKKKETEIEKLKNTIQKTSTDRSSQVKFGMEVVNPVTKSMSSDVNPTKDVHNLLVEAHHRRERELKNEVDELRKVLFDAHLLLAEQLQNLNDTDAPTPVGEYTQRVETFRVSSDIPFDILRGALGESVSEALIYLKEQGLDSRSKLEELESMMQDQFEQIFELERQLGESKEIIEQQERLLERKLEMDINPSEPLMLPLDEIDQSLKALESER
jgi:DNA repair exonuclease SbcCD ATPase subunit